MSGNFGNGQGNLERTWKVREFENKWLLLGSKFFPLILTPKFEVIQLAPLN